MEITKEVFVWPLGHMKTMLYENPRAGDFFVTLKESTHWVKKKKTLQQR